MALIKSISGIRGTIGGKAGDNLTPQDIVECTAAFGTWLKNKGANPKVVIGRDARISGELVSQMVSNTLLALGIDVVDLGLSTTPTVEMAVPELEAGAGIILTASHNPKQWNALKLLNNQGEFISAEDGKAFLSLIEEGGITYVEVDEIGDYSTREDMFDYHIDQILALDLVDVPKVQDKKFKVVVDCINSTGALSLPPLLDKLNCDYILINSTPDGNFAHNPEPLPKHLTELSETVEKEQADLGIAVDPDVDRLVFVNEDGSHFGEEYTLVAVADYILGRKMGNTVSNLSSSRALRDVTNKHGGKYFAAAVGEVNVVQQMKDQNAVIGGEGNGGIILPELHYGRDALVGIALLLTHLANSGKKMSELRAEYPTYHMTKDKVDLDPQLDMEGLLKAMHEKYKHEDCNTIDGLKIDFENSWVQLRKSNTEPIIRIYAEAEDEKSADELVARIKKDFGELSS
ncbi:MAG: phosphoglucosamine mutase [Bacteroidetes bacterium]|nr:MAG: phosphoglucosamine mutase [Bacteroidota bacterium]